MSTAALEQGCRTVLQMAAYLESLKRASSEYEDRFEASLRGYFDATEDEQAQGLLVSYYYTRVALHELIREMTEESEATDDYPQRFLVGFSAALLLVDAARHLRTIAADRPVVRRKLNQAVPAFGIPGGLYDEVQASLLSSRQGWKLLQAHRYYRSHRDALAKAAKDTFLEPLLGIIEELIERVDVPVLDFLSAKVRTQFDRSLRSLGRTLIQQTLYGLQRYGSSQMADVYVKPGHAPCLPDAIRKQVLAIAAPGDVFVVRKEYALTNYFLPGHWPHAALYLGSADDLLALGIDQQPFVAPRWQHIRDILQPGVLESMKDGVRLRNIASPFASDSIVVIRPRISRSQIGEALARVLRHEGKPYDFDFDFGRSDRLVCTEVVYRAYEGIGDVRFPLVKRAGRPTLSGADLLEMARTRAHFEPVACYAQQVSEQVLQGTAVDPVLERFSPSGEE